MTQDHPITPPPELIEEWRKEWHEGWTGSGPYMQSGNYIAIQAARWGADQELEACVAWMQAAFGDIGDFPEKLRAARRPKPPSLKEQALALIDGCTDPQGDYLDDAALDTIRRALEALPDD